MKKTKSVAPPSGGATAVHRRRTAGWARLVALGAMLALLMSMFAGVFGSVNGAWAVDCADEPDHEDCAAQSYSLYKLSSNVSAYFDNSNAPENDGMTEPWTSRVSGVSATGGSVLGYVDPDFSWSLEWAISRVTTGSNSQSYESLANNEERGTYYGPLSYGYFGAANQDLGLANVVTAGGFFGKMFGNIGAFMMLFAYIGTVAVGVVFMLVVKLLQLLNPFMWFEEAVRNNIGGTFADGMTQGNDANPLFSSVASFINEWYTILQNMAWQVLVPLFLGLLLFSLIMVKQNRGNKVKKFVVRLMFIGLGLPLLGSMYTGVLNKFDTNPVSITGPTKAVASTYLDFGSWALNKRLAIPENATIEWDARNGKATSDAMMNVRRSALEINATAVPGYSSLANDPDFSDGNSAQESYEDNSVSVVLGDAENMSKITATFNLLTKFMGDSKVTASDFEGLVKESIGDIADSVVDAKKKEMWFQGSYLKPKEGADFGMGKEDDGVAVTDNPVINVAPTKGLMSTPEVFVDEDADPNQMWWARFGVVHKFSTEGTACYGGQVVSADGGLSDCNLSALAMYNYLNTDFGKDGYTVYSPGKSVSDATRGVYAAGTQVGTGPMKFMYWSNTMTLLTCIVLIGFWYAFGMLFGSVKRMIQLVAAVPFATVGAMAAIAKVITYAVAMILEVIGTLFVYQFVIQIFVSLPEIINSPMTLMMSSMEDMLGDAGGVTSTISFILSLIATGLSTVVIWVMAFLMLKARKGVMKGIDENVTKIVDKFLDTQTAPGTGGPGMLPAMGQAAAAGAGLAAGNKAMGALGNKLGGGGNKANVGDGPTNVGGTNGEKPGSNDPMDPSSNGGGGDDPRDPRDPHDPKDPTGPDGGGLSGRGGEGGEAGARGADGSDDVDGPDGPENEGSPNGNDPVTSSGSVQSDKETEAALKKQGGLTDYGVAGKDGKVPAAGTGAGPDAGFGGAAAAAGAAGAGVAAAKAGPGAAASGISPKKDAVSTPAKSTRVGARAAGVKRGQNNGDLVHKMGRNAKGELVSQGLVRRDSLPEAQRANAPAANAEEIRMAGGLDRATAAAGGLALGEKAMIPNKDQAARWNTPVSQVPAGVPVESIAMQPDAQPGSLPLRSEAIAQMGGKDAVIAQAKAKGMTPEQYMQQHGPATLDDANPLAAQMVTKAGGTKAYLQKQAAMGTGAAGKNAVGSATRQATAGAVPPGTTPPSGGSTGRVASGSPLPTAGAQQGKAAASVAGAGAAGEAPAPAAARGAGPVPLEQVPFTSKGNYVIRGSDESDLQYLKRRASAEGWAQTPQGWVQSAQQPQPQAQRPAGGGSGQSVPAAGAKAPMAQATSAIPAPGDLSAAVNAPAPAQAPRAQAGPAPAAAPAQQQPAPGAKPRGRRAAQAGSEGPAPQAGAQARPVDAGAGSFPAAPAPAAGQAPAASVSQGARRDRAQSVASSAKRGAPGSAPVPTAAGQKVQPTVVEIQQGVQAAGFNPAAVSKTQPQPGKVVPFIAGNAKTQPYVAAKQTLINSGWNPGSVDEGMKRQLEQMAMDLKLQPGTLPTPAQVTEVQQLSSKRKGRRRKGQEGDRK